MPGDEDFDDPSWQAFYAFRWICEVFLGYPAPTALGSTSEIEVRKVTPEQVADMRAYFRKPSHEQTEDERRRLFTESERRRMFPGDDT